MDFALHRRAKAWVARQLRLHYRLRGWKVAQETGVARCTLCQAEAGKYLHDFGTLDRLVCHYGYPPWVVDELTWRWLRKHDAREYRLHAGEKDFVISYPWER